MASRRREPWSSSRSPPERARIPASISSERKPQSRVNRGLVSVSPLILSDDEPVSPGRSPSRRRPFPSATRPRHQMGWARWGFQMPGPPNGGAPRASQTDSLHHRPCLASEMRRGRCGPIQRLIRFRGLLHSIHAAQILTWALLKVRVLAGDIIAEVRSLCLCLRVDACGARRPRRL